MSIDWTEVIYTILAIISTSAGYYVSVYFFRMWRTLKQPPYFRTPFLIMGIINFLAATIYLLGLVEYDGFAAVSATGRYIRVLVIGFEIMPYVIAKSMERLSE